MEGRRTADDMVAAIRRFAGEHGRPPFQSEWGRAERGLDSPPASRVKKLFGSWSAGLETAGFGGRVKRWDRKSILDAIG